MALPDPPIVVTRVAPRAYELDATGTLPPGGFARALEHARWEAVAVLSASGALFSRGVVRGQRWRFSGRPIGFGDAIEVTSWIGRVGRTSFDFVHRLTLVDGGDPVATTAATVVRLSASTGRPEPVPDSIHGLVVPGDPAPEVPLPPDRPLVGEVPTFSLERLVAPSDCDLNRHLNQARYVDQVDDLRLLGVQAGVFDASIAGAPAALRIDYAREARPRTTVRATGRLEGPGELAVVLEDAEGGEVLAAARVLGRRPVSSRSS